MLPGRWMEIVGGGIIGCFGFWLLARLDIPDIVHGGLGAIYPAIELTFAGTLLLAAFVLRSRFDDDVSQPS